MAKLSIRLAAGLFMLAASAMPTAAQTPDFWERNEFWGAAPQSVSYTSPDDTVRFNAGIGAIYLEGNEYVFNGDRILSQLIWQSRAPVLRGNLAVDIGAFNVSVEGSVAGFGSSYMEDYDWLIATDNFDNWTHRSQHPDTNLDYFASGALSAGYEVANSGDAVVRLHGGLKYTDVQWSASGGSYVYSEFGFRDAVGNFADGEPAIRYRQKLPEIFLGADGEQHYGNVRLGGLLRGGLTVFTQSNDNHWMRDLLVVDTFGVSPTFELGADVGFALGPLAEAFIAARYEHKFLMRGMGEYFDTLTGIRTIVGDDIAGADLRSIDVTAGIKGRF
jgi:outer membrane protease